MAGEACGPVHIVRAYIDDEQLVLLLMDDFRCRGTEAFHFGCRQRAKENAELDVFAVVFE